MRLLRGVPVRLVVMGLPGPVPITRETPEVSRFSCILFRGVLGVLDYAGPGTISPIAPIASVAFPQSGQGRHPDLCFRSSIPCPPVPLSTLRLPPHDDLRKTRGQDGFATPFLWGSRIPDNMPVYPGAP